MGDRSMKTTISNKMKKVISTALAAVMTISLFPLKTGINAYAEEDPYVELTNTLTAQDTFAWTEYDHDNYTDSYLGFMSDHIIYDGNNIQMVGYGVSPFKDFLFVDNDNEVNEYTDLKQTFTFDIQRDSTSWHSMECGGFLFNSSIKDGVLNGFGLLITNGYIKLIRLQNMNVANLHEGAPSSLITSSNTLKSVSFPNSTAVHSMKIEVYNNTISVWDGDTKIIDSFTLPQNDYGYGYGPITSYASHSCSQKSYFTFANIKMEEVVIHYIPKKPAALLYSVNKDSSVTLNWTQPEGKAEVVGYNIYRDDSLIGTTVETAYTDETATSLGNFTYYVSAFDTENYTSENSDTVTVDNLSPVAPVLMIDSVGETSASLTWECSDNVGVESYDIYRNDEFITSVTTNSYTDSTLEEGTSYTYYVIAYDASGNKSDKSNTITINTGIDETQPIISSISPSNGKYSGTLPIKVTVTDSRSVSSVTIQASIDNSNWKNVAQIAANGKATVVAEYDLDLSAYNDGKLYIRAYAVNSRNISSDVESSPVMEYTIDSTAPAVPSGVVINLYNSQIEIKWDSPKDKDTSYFKVYRKSDLNSEFSVIKDNHKYLNYYDTNIELGVNYTYCISAVDRMGNESAMSSEVSGSIADDKVIPEILSVYPENGGVLKNHQLIGISAKDNYKLDSITVECRPENGNWYTVFSEENINNYAKVVQFELDTSTFTTGIYEIRFFAEDTAGNISEYVTNSYSFKECEMSVPVLSVEAGNLESSLLWTMENDTDVAYYKIYRSNLGSFEYVHKTAKKEYVDTDLAAKKYTYYVVAVDKYGNNKTSEYVDVTPHNVDGKEPVAYAGADIVAFENENVSFDGTASTDNVGVVAYRWDFGDGTSSESGVTVHSYDEVGTYDALLTVYDEAGNIGTATKRITVLDSDNLSAELTVTTSSNVPIKGVMVYYELDDGSKSTIYTDKNGKAVLKSSEGALTVYLYKNGYAPQKKTLTIGKNSLNHKIKLLNEEFVKGEIKVKELDLQEMIEHGVDISAPENQAVFEVSVQVAYAEDTDGNSEFSVLINTDGQIIPGSIIVENDEFICESDTSGNSVTVKSKSGGSTTYTPIIGTEKELMGIAVLRISQNITWLKECFEVELTVQNLADEAFPINNAVASLNIPSELSLAKTNILQNIDIPMGNISGGETKSASWVVMGAQQGEYEISADFSGILMPFEAAVSMNFKSAEKIKVYGSSALEYYQHSRVYTDDGMKIITYFTVTNVSDKPIYNVSANLGDIKELNDVKEMKLVYPDGTVIYVKRDSGTTPKPEFLAALRKTGDYGYLELKPGESVIGTHSVSISEEAMQAAAQAVNNLNLIADENGMLCNSIGTIDTAYYDNSTRAIAVSLAKKINNRDIISKNGQEITAKALTVVTDISTGKVYIGLSGMDDENPTRSSKEAFLLTQRIDDVCNEYGCDSKIGLTSRPRNMRNCGEYNAINNALNDGAISSNLCVYTVHIANGDYLRPCKNCLTLYCGYVNFIGDDSAIDVLPMAS